MQWRIPGEHEKHIERRMRTIRERINVAISQLKDKGLNLPKCLYDQLTVDVVHRLNIPLVSYRMTH